MPSLKRKHDDLRRSGNAAGQTKITFSSKSKNSPNSATSNTSLSAIAESNDITPTNDPSQSVSTPSTCSTHVTSPQSASSSSHDPSKDKTSTQDNSVPNATVSKSYDLADIVNGRIKVKDLPREEIYNYYTKQEFPSENDILYSETFTKSGKSFKLSYKRKWLTDHKWHVYSKELDGGLCKACVLFDDPNNVNRGSFVKSAFQNISKPEKVPYHETLQYHQDNLTAAKQFVKAYEDVKTNVDFDPKANERYQNNIHVVKRIIEAILLCAEQGIALRGHRDHHQTSEADHFERPANRGNFLAILETFALHDEILRQHLLYGQKNAKMVSWRIQNDIIACIAQFIRGVVRKILSRSKHYSIIADEVTDRYANKEILLICLRFLNLTGNNISIEEMFFDSLHLQGRPTGQTIAKGIIKSLKDNKIDIRDCRGQSYDGASAMKSETKGTQAAIKEVAPKAPYTHCRSHTINLSIAFSCKNQSIIRFMDNITSLCYFFANSPKRQQYLENFMEFFKEELSVQDTRRKEVIGLAKTRWVERHRAYDTYYLLHKYVIACLDSIAHPYLYSEFLDHLTQKFNEPWIWDSETKVKAQGLHSSLLRFENMISFSILFNGLEPLKPLVSKLQKRNQDIFDAYHMIDTVIADLEAAKKDIDTRFHDWYTLAVEMGEAVGVKPSTPRLAKAWSRFRNSLPHENPEIYYRRSIAIPVMDNLINDLRDRMKERSHVDTFALLPSVMFRDSFDLKDSASILRSAYREDLCSDGVMLENEMIRWKKFWENNLQKSQVSTSKVTAKQSEAPADKRRKRNIGKRVDGKSAYQIVEPPDGLLDCLNLADEDCFPNIRKLLMIGCLSPVGSSEAERAASGIRRLKTAYRSTMNDDREGNLNLIQLQRITNVDIDKVVDIFLKKQKRRLFTKFSVLFDEQS